MESYPAQVTADKVIITDTSNSPSTAGIGIPCDEFGSQNNIIKELEITYPGLLVVTLCSNPSTGFEWPEKAKISAPAVLEQQGHEFIGPASEPPPPPGTPWQEVWNFKALKKAQAGYYLSIASRGKVALKQSGRLHLMLGSI